MGVPTLIVNDTAPERHHGCARVMRTLRTLCAAHELAVIDTIPVHTSWREHRRIDERLGQAKLIIVNGEGSLHNGGKQAEDILSIADAARARGIPAVLINASWEANPPHLLKLVSAFALVAVRESKSQLELSRNGVNAVCAPDLSLYLPYRGGVSPIRRGALFTDSVVLETAAALADRRLALGGEEISIFETSRHADLVWKARMAAARARSTPAGGRLKAFATNWPGATPARDDMALLRTIASARILVTGRFHAACFALLVETPLLVTESNTHKISALLKDAGLETWRLLDTPQSIDRARLDVAAQIGTHELQAVRDYLDAGRMAVRHIFKEICSLC